MKAVLHDVRSNLLSLRRGSQRKTDVAPSTPSVLVPTWPLRTLYAKLVTMLG